ncbi:MAG: PorT family protein [Hymenobacter sp.]|nr:MAG: PorT family protein [Hymenobacter sp.]
MKKIILSLALLAGAAGVAHAQTGVKYGLKGGFNTSTFSGADSKGSNYKVGFNAGVLLNFGVSDNFSIQPEFVYSQKGVNIKDYSYGGNTTNRNKTTLGYLDVPIMFRYNIGQDGKGLYVEVGPQGSFALHARSFIEDVNGNEIAGTRTTNTDPLNKVIIGYAGGLGYQITSGLGLNVRYTGGFSQVYKQNPGALNVHNSVFQFQVGYAFGGK